MKPSFSNKDRPCLNGILEATQKILWIVEDIQNPDAFYEDAIKFDAAMMNFVVIGEMAEKLSLKLKSSSSQIDWVKIKDFRNLIAHDYFGIDAEEVWQIIQTHLPALRTNVELLLKDISLEADGVTATNPKNNPTRP